LVRGDPQSILLSKKKKKKKKTKIIMFFHVRREKNVVLEPRHFGARMKDVIMEKIKLEVRPVCFAFAFFLRTISFHSRCCILGVDEHT
jgi:hypothetical protein